MDLDYWNRHEDLFKISNEGMRDRNYRLDEITRLRWFLYFILFLLAIKIIILTIMIFF